jgi:hypothetical protein
VGSRGAAEGRSLGPGYAHSGDHRVDHTQYDTASSLRLITKVFGLPTLPGLAQRDSALQANGLPPMGDMTAALNLGPTGGSPDALPAPVNSRWMLLLSALGLIGLAGFARYRERL